MTEVIKIIKTLPKGRNNNEIKFENLNLYHSAIVTL